jgi:Ran GTPase-activating protein (RanGAP) involved in mRNA processing and transport
MSTRLSETIASLHETQTVDLEEADIDAEGAAALADALKENTSVANLNLEDNAIGAQGASALADALKVNTSVKKIDLEGNGIGAAGASALADALKVNTSVTEIYLGGNGIGDEGASALADALKVNISVTNINLRNNKIGAEGASALVDALKVNTSVTVIHFDVDGIDATSRAQVDTLTDRNERLRRLFLFDARQMLLSVLCADECGVVWPYLLDGDDLDAVKVSSVAESLRAEFAVVVEERRHALPQWRVKLQLISLKATIPPSSGVARIYEASFV